MALPLKFLHIFPNNFENKFRLFKCKNLRNKNKTFLFLKNQSVVCQKTEEWISCFQANNLFILDIDKKTKEQLNKDLT